MPHALVDRFMLVTLLSHDRSLLFAGCVTVSNPLLTPSALQTDHWRPAPYRSQPQFHRRNQGNKPGAYYYYSQTPLPPQVKPLPTDTSILKVTKHAVDTWETPRAPFEVVFDYCIASTAEVDTMPTWREAKHTIGTHTLPPGIELALCSMALGEEARFVVPTDLLRGGAGGDGSGGDGSGGDCAAPNLGVGEDGSVDAGAFGAPEGDETAHVHLRLTHFVEIRDMTGDQQVRFVAPTSSVATTGDSPCTGCRYLT